MPTSSPKNTQRLVLMKEAYGNGIGAKSVNVVTPANIASKNFAQHRLMIDAVRRWGRKRPAASVGGRISGFHEPTGLGHVIAVPQPGTQRLLHRIDDRWPLDLLHVIEHHLPGRQPVFTFHAAVRLGERE